MEKLSNIKTDEGYSKLPYLCSEGYMTWLHGRNLESNPITEEEWKLLKNELIKYDSDTALENWAEMLLNQEIIKLKDILKRSIHYFSDLPQNVQNIIINMAYNMGTGRFNSTKWPKFFAAVENKTWDKAADEMGNSKWFKQVGSRAVRLVKNMRDQV